jgi:hypothetical protein
MGDLQSYLDNLNSKVGLTPSGRKPVNRTRRKTTEKTLRLEKKVSELRIRDFELNKPDIFTIEKYIKLRKRKVINMPYYDENVKNFRFFYVRYADDCILLTNSDLPVI